MARRSQLHDRVEGADGSARWSQLRDRDEKAYGAAELLLTGRVCDPNCRVVAFYRQCRVERIQQQNFRSSGTNSKAKALRARAKQWALSARLLAPPHHSRGRCRPLRVIPKAPGHPFRVKGIDSNPGFHHRDVRSSSVLSRLSCWDG